MERPDDKPPEDPGKPGPDAEPLGGGAGNPPPPPPPKDKP